MSHKGFFVRVKSQFDRTPLIVVFSLASENIKTSDMIQTWIIPEHLSPLENYYKKLDNNICGSCIHKRSFGGDCYVRIEQGSLALYRSFLRGNYIELNFDNQYHIAALRQKPIRFGAYGDPLAIPFHFWQIFLEKINPIGWTSYTSSWYLKRAQPYKNFCMASVFSLNLKEAANELGWRTFRVIYEYDQISDDEILVDMDQEIFCPSTEQGGFRKNCADCLLCSGNTQDKEIPTGNIAVLVHGVFKNRLTLERRNKEEKRILKYVARLEKCYG